MSDVDMREDNREEAVEAEEAVVPVNKNKRFRKEKRQSIPEPDMLSSTRETAYTLRAAY